MRVTNVVGLRVGVAEDLMKRVLVTVGVVASTEGTGGGVAEAAGTWAEIRLSTGALPLPATYSGGPGSG